MPIIDHFRAFSLCHKDTAKGKECSWGFKCLRLGPSPSEVYQCRKARRLNMETNWSSILLNNVCTEVELARNVPDSFTPEGFKIVLNFWFLVSIDKFGLKDDTKKEGKNTDHSRHIQVVNMTYI